MAGFCVCVVVAGDRVPPPARHLLTAACAPPLAAHQVGVGISGREGLQAVNSSDFAIAQFRFLEPLLLVHGRWSYRRMAKVFLYSFYKNVVITFTLFYFNFFTGWSGTSLYESLVYSGFNFFLGLPIIGIGIFDRCARAPRRPAFVELVSCCCLLLAPSPRIVRGVCRDL